MEKEKKRDRMNRGRKLTIAELFVSGHNITFLRLLSKRSPKIITLDQSIKQNNVQYKQYRSHGREKQANLRPIAAQPPRDVSENTQAEHEVGDDVEDVVDLEDDVAFLVATHEKDLAEMKKYAVEFYA